MEALPTISDPQESELRRQVRALIADRHTAEARALYLQLARYSHSRVHRHASSRYPDVLSHTDEEEIVGEVLYQLMSGALASFRGETLPELLAFCRRVSDRCVWRAARKKLRERDALDGIAGEHVRDWNCHLPSPEEAVRLIPETPLSTTDQTYLLALLRAGSRSEYARQAGVSRAAVTQRVQRIRARIRALSEADQSATEVWLRHSAERMQHEARPTVAD